MKRVATLLTRLLLLISIAYVIVLALLFFFQEKIIFPASTLAADYKFDFKSRFEERSVFVEGRMVNSLYFNAEKPRGAILYFHGNGGSLDMWGDVAQELVKRTSYDVEMMDYPGYGKSPGPFAAEKFLHQMSLTFYQELQKKAPAKIVIYGRSIGTGLAVRLASSTSPAALILESPYRSMSSVVQAIFPWIPTFLLRFKLDSGSRIAKVPAPILIFHGDQDEVIPYANSRELAALVPAAKFVTIAAGGHNDLSSSKIYWSELSSFLDHL